MNDMTITKSRNPFIVWGEHSGQLIGRTAEILRFRNFLDAIRSNQTAILVLQGTEGMGKTALLNQFRFEVKKRKVPHVFINAKKGVKEWELSQQLLKEFRAVSYEQLSFLESIQYVLQKEPPFIIFIDNITRPFKLEQMLNEFSNHIAENGISQKHKKGFGLVIATDLNVEGHDRVKIQLAPLNISSAKEIVQTELNGTDVKIDDACVLSILNDSGGNTRLFKTICWYLYEMLRVNQKVMSKAHYLTYLQSCVNLLSKQWFESIWNKTPHAERKILSVFINSNSKDQTSENSEKRVIEISNTLAKPIGQTTALIKRLLDRGQLIRLERGKYDLFSKLYGRFIGDVIKKE